MLSKLNLQSFFFKRLYIKRIFHSLGFCQVIVEQQLYLIHAGNNICAGVAIRIDGKRDVRPVEIHLEQSFFQVALLSGRFGYRVEFRHIIA